MQKNFKPDLVLVDGSSYLFRAYHALPALENSHGEPTGVIYGVINMLRKLRADYPTEYIAVVFDAKGKNFRHTLYPEYKANRGETPEELKLQFKPLCELIRQMGLPLIMEEGVEADDVIATLAKSASAKNMKTLISTGDKDIAQLVDDQVVLINTMTGKLLDQAGVEEKFGVKPNQIVDYLTLIGDAVDNIKGVPKVGPKTASKWINEFETLDNIIENADGFSGKIGENLRESLAQLPLSRELIILKKDVPLREKIEELTPQNPDKDKLIELFKHFEFRAWLSELLKNSDAEKNNQYEVILDQAHLEKWLDKLEKSDIFAFDTETTGLSVMDAEMVGISFSVKAGEAAYVPFIHNYEGKPEQLSRSNVLQQMLPLFTFKHRAVVGQNIKFDLKMLMNENIQITSPIMDTQMLSYVLSSGSGRHDMNTLSLKYLGKKPIHYEDVAGKGAKQVTFDKVPLEQAAPYAAEDADITLQLYETLWSRLSKDKNLIKIYSEVEIPLISVLANMEYKGVLIDENKLKKQSEQIAIRLEELTEKIHEMAGERFNIASTKQLREILYEKLKLPILSKTPKGMPSTAEGVLQELALDYQLPQLILEFRTLSKLKSTYTDSLPKEISSTTGRVHTSYHQAATSTGRLSSVNPNLQNIPIRTEEGRRIRQAFIAPRGFKIVAADYSQIELRIMAHLTQDKNLLKAFENGYDIHTATASEVFNVAIEEVTSDQRRSAKTINFGIIYGMSAFGLSKQLGITNQLAKNYIDLYFSRYPKIKQYMEDTQALAHEQGFVETLIGRKLYLPDINSSNALRRKAMERAAINAPMQGTAADIIKIAMIKMNGWLSQNEVDANMIMQVHDELVFEVAEKNVTEVVEKIRSIMMHSVELSVPLEVSVGVGDNWDEAH